MQRRAVTIPLAAFMVGVLISPLAAAIPAANADAADSPCASASTAGSVLPPAPTAEQPAAEAAPATPATAARDAAVPTPPRIRFSELFPDPEGADDLGEFIELENDDATDADLAGWSIRNAAGKTFALTVRLGPKARYAFTYAETKIPLANTGGTLTLADAAGGVADTVTYAGPAKTGKTYARTADGTWEWTPFATPGDENRFEPVVTAPVPATTTAQEPAVPPATETTATASAAAVLADQHPDPATTHVAIVGLLPDPVGDDAEEWIELGNDGQAPATLTGWKLDDAEGGSDPYPLDGITVPAGGSIRVSRAASKIALNNDGDDVRLIGPDGNVRQAVAYANAPEGKTYALIEGSWRWSPADGGAAASGPVAGAVEAPPETPATAAPEPSGGDAEQPVASSVGDLVPGDDSLLEVEGIVTLIPGIVGKRTFAMQDPAGQGGMFVRAYGPSPLPPLAPGDRIRVVGRAAPGAVVALSTVGKRVTRLSAGRLDHEERDAADVTDDANGAALAVTGIVARRSRTSLALSDGTARGEIAVRMGTRTAIDPRVAVGASVTAKGVLRVRDGARELIVTGKDGIMPLAPPPKPAASEGLAAPRPGIAAEPQHPEPRKPLVFGYTAEKTASAFAMGGIAAAVIAAVAVVAVLARRRRIEALDRLDADR